MGDNQRSSGVVIVRSRSLGGLDHQRRDLHPIKLSYLTEDRPYPFYQIGCDICYGHGCCIGGAVHDKAAPHVSRRIGDARWTRASDWMQGRSPPVSTTQRGNRQRGEIVGVGQQQGFSPWRRCAFFSFFGFSLF
jgi:hypothetical protein